MLICMHMLLPFIQVKYISARPARFPHSPMLVLCIGGLHCRHVGVQNKRTVVHIVCLKFEVNSKRREVLSFLYTNMAAMMPYANHQNMTALGIGGNHAFSEI